MYARLSVIIKHVSTILLLRISGLSTCPLDTLIHCLMRVFLSCPGLCLLSLLVYIVQSTIRLMIRFMPPIRISSQMMTLMSELFPSLLFDVDKRGRRSWRCGDLGVIFLVFWLYDWYFGL